MVGETEVPVVWLVGEAQSPTVSTTRLRELAQHESMAVREAGRDG